MINGFENITYELTDEERTMILPLVKQMISNREHGEDAITNKEMVDTLYHNFGIMTSGPRMRKIIHALRLSGELEFVVANSKGYYICKNPKKLKEYEESLMQRAESILDIANQIKFQRQKLEKNGR